MLVSRLLDMQAKVTWLLSARLGPGLVAQRRSAQNLHHRLDWTGQETWTAALISFPGSFQMRYRFVGSLIRVFSRKRHASQPHHFYLFFLPNFDAQPVIFESSRLCRGKEKQDGGESFPAYSSTRAHSNVFIIRFIFNFLN